MACQQVHYIQFFALADTNPRHQAGQFVLNQPNLKMEDHRL